MRSEKLNPYSLLITDPLWSLHERRKIIEGLFDSGDLKPIYVFKNNDLSYLIFNGNKRTVIARERFTYIPSSIIENDSDLFTAQNNDFRNIPKFLNFDYKNVLEHLQKRANNLLDVNNRYSPTNISEGYDISRRNYVSS